jgi:hypothetical protein
MKACRFHPDRPVSCHGLCLQCYNAWHREGRPSGWAPRVKVAPVFGDTIRAPAPIPAPDPVDARRVKLATAKERKLLDSQVARARRERACARRPACDAPRAHL